jgi:hypothetical protein
MHTMLGAVGGLRGAGVKKKGTGGGQGRGGAGTMSEREMEG